MGAGASTLSTEAQKAVEDLPEPIRKEIHAKLNYACPVRNDHEALGKIPDHSPDMTANWLLFLPAAAISVFRLEPNMSTDAGVEPTIWVGRLKAFRKIMHLQYLSEKMWSNDVPDERKTALEKRFGDGGDGAKVLVKMQARIKGWYTRHRQKPLFLEELSGAPIKAIMCYMHGSGGLSWANPRMCCIAAMAGCVVFAPDHMSSSEYRSKTLKPHVKTSEITYWTHNFMYGSNIEVKEGEEDLHFSTSVGGVLKDPEYYKKLYERVYQVRRAELHFLLSRLPKVATDFGVILFGTSEGAMTVHRFDDQRYGFVKGRIVNAFGCEYCYFTPTEESALLGGSKTVPTLNMIGTTDEYFGPPPDDKVTYLKGYKLSKETGLYGTPGSKWEGSIAYKIAQDKESGYGSPASVGHGFEAFKKQKLRKALVATIVDAQHDATLNHDNEVKDVLLSFLANPEMCTEVYDRLLATAGHFAESVALKGKHKEEGSEAVHIELSAPHKVFYQTPYSRYLIEAKRWARKQKMAKAAA